MLFSSFWKRGPGPPLWGPGGVLGPPPGSAPGVCDIVLTPICPKYGVIILNVSEIWISTNSSILKSFVISY